MIAGSEGMGGAGILASEASLYCGSGLVTLFTHKSNVEASLVRNPEIMALGIQDRIESPDNINVFLIGPGFTNDKWSEIAYKCLSTNTKNAYLIFDAGALYFLSEPKKINVSKSENLRIKELILNVSKAIFKNSLMIGIGLGFVANFLNLSLPAFASDTLDLIVRAALPAALFGLGGVLVRYNPRGDLKLIAYLCVISLIIHPLITMIIAKSIFALPPETFYPAIITAAMAPGMNAYMFANMYGKAKQIAASTVLVGTILSVFTVSIWLLILS